MNKILNFLNLGPSNKEQKANLPKDSCQSNHAITPTTQYSGHTDKKNHIHVETIPTIIITEHEDDVAQYIKSEFGTLENQNSSERKPEKGHSQELTQIEVDTTTSDHEEEAISPEIITNASLAMIPIDLRKEGVLIDDENVGYDIGIIADQRWNSVCKDEEGGEEKYQEDAKMATSGTTSISDDNDEDEGEDDDDDVNIQKKEYVASLLHSDTSEDFDNLPLEYISEEQSSRVFIHDSEDVLGQSIHKDHNQMEQEFESEKEDIVKGFILEKEVMEEEHRKEKDSLINEFVKEKHDLLETFHSQVAEIEKKLRKSQGSGSRPSSRASDKQANSNVLIKLSEREVLTPEEFLSTLKLEEKFETEKEDIEREYRKQKKELVERLRLDFNSTLISERIKHENIIEDLKLQIRESESQRRNLEDRFKQRSEDLEFDFDKERVLVQRKHDQDVDEVRQSIESQYEIKLENQRADYEKVISKLKDELRSAVEALSSEKQRATDAGKRFRIDELEVRRTLREEVRFEFEKEIRQLREENVKLMNEAAIVGEDNVHLNRQLKSMEVSDEDRSKMLQDLSQKLTDEYEEKFRSVIAENEHLEESLRQLELERDRLHIAFRDCENEEKKLLEKFDVKERTFVQQETKIEALRNESEILSKEVSLLRNEKEQFAEQLRQSEELKRQCGQDLESTKSSFIEEKQRCQRLEQEKLLIEKSVAKLRQEIQQISIENNERERQYKSMEEESVYLRKLLENERKEHSRFRQRFEDDAELIRKKEKEIFDLRQKLDQESQTSSTNKSKQSDLEHKRLKLEAENTALHHKIHNLADATDTLLQQERVLLQQKFTKEFNERVEFIKSSYERENHGLRKNIDLLKRKLSERGNSATKPKHKVDSSPSCLSQNEDVINSKATRSLTYDCKPLQTHENNCQISSHDYRRGQQREISHSKNREEESLTYKEEKSCCNEQPKGRTMLNNYNLDSKYSTTAKRRSESLSQVPVMDSENFANTDLYPTKDLVYEQPTRLLDGGTYKFARSSMKRDSISRPSDLPRSTRPKSCIELSTSSLQHSSTNFDNTSNVNNQSAIVPHNKPPLGNRLLSLKGEISAPSHRRCSSRHERSSSMPRLSNYFSNHSDEMQKMARDAKPIDSSTPNGCLNRSDCKIRMDVGPHSLRSQHHDTLSENRRQVNNPALSSSLDTENDIVRRLKERQQFSKHPSSPLATNDENEKLISRLYGDKTNNSRIARDSVQKYSTTRETDRSQLIDPNKGSAALIDSSEHRLIDDSNIDNQNNNMYSERLQIDISESSDITTRPLFNYEQNTPPHVGNTNTTSVGDLQRNLLLKEVDSSNSNEPSASFRVSNDFKCTKREPSRLEQNLSSCKAYMNHHSRKLETAIESLKDRMNSDQDELMAALNDLNKENILGEQHSDVQAKKFKTVIARVRTAEKDSKDKEIRKLLKEVRREVLILNTLLEKERSSGSSMEESPRIRASDSVKPQSNSGHESYRDDSHKHDMALIEKEAKLARLYASDLRAKLEQRDREASDSRQLIGNLYSENEELYSAIEEKDRKLSYKQQSCEKLLRKRLALEKAVDRLQVRLKDLNKEVTIQSKSTRPFDENGDLFHDDCTV